MINNHGEWKHIGYKHVAGKLVGNKFNGMGNIEYKEFRESKWKYELQQ